MRVNNHNTIKSMSDPNKQKQPFPNAIEKALENANRYFDGTVGIEYPDKVVKQSLMNIQQRVSDIEESITEEPFIKLLTEEIKIVALENTAMPLLQGRLNNLGIDDVDPHILLPLINSYKHFFTNAISQPSNKLSDTFEEILQKLTNQVYHILFTTKALNDVKMNVVG